MAFPALGDQAPQPEPVVKACSTAPSQASGTDYRQQDCFFVAGGTANASVAVESGTPATAVAQSSGTPSNQKFTRASAPAPVCGYVPLAPDELKSPWAWAGAVAAATWTPKPGRFPVAPVSYYKAGIPDSMKDLGVQPSWYICDGYRRLVYSSTPPPSGGTPGKAPAAAQPDAAQHAAAALEATLSVPGLGISVSPDQAGITGLVSYFWLTGFDGKPFYKQADPSPLGTGWLRATPLYYQWSFGDGSGVTATSIGEAYPRISQIAHTYDVRSDKSPMATQGLYRVSVTAFFQVAFQVSAPGQSLVANGQWVDFATYGLPPLQASVTHAYRVREVRQILTG